MSITNQKKYLHTFDFKYPAKYKELNLKHILFSKLWEVHGITNIFICLMSLTIIYNYFRQNMRKIIYTNGTIS